MDTLRPGDKGADVEVLQRRLAELGFSTGAIDGDFGPATEAALKGFQLSRNLLPDAIAGPRTLVALGLSQEVELPSAIPEVTVERTCVMFPATPRANIMRNLPVVLDGLVKAELTDKPMVLMALATIRAETEGFVPLSEGMSKFNTSPGGRPFDLYDMRTDIGNGQIGDGEKYRGRGFIQLTGKANYLQHGRAIGMGDQLVSNPDLANDPVIAAQLLASFLSVKEQQIKEALLDGNLAQARKLVNGGTNGLDRFTDCYNRGDQLLTDT